MCMKSPKMPDQTPPPAPAPMPSPQPTEVESQQTAEQRRNKISAMRYGLIGTIKNAGGAAGISGAGADLITPSATGKKKLGE